MSSPELCAVFELGGGGWGDVHKISENPDIQITGMSLVENRGCLVGMFAEINRFF